MSYTELSDRLTKYTGFKWSYVVVPFTKREILDILHEIYKELRRTIFIALVCELFILGIIKSWHNMVFVWKLYMVSELVWSPRHALPSAEINVVEILIGYRGLYAVLAIFQFLKRSQMDVETFEKFLTYLRLLVKECGYHDLEELIREISVQHKESRGAWKVYHEVREKCIMSCVKSVSTKAQIDAINCARLFWTIKIRNSVDERQISTQHFASYSESTSPKSSVSEKIPDNVSKPQRIQDCRNCGKTHDYKQCPVYGEICVGSSTIFHSSVTQTVYQQVFHLLNHVNRNKIKRCML